MQGGRDTETQGHRDTGTQGQGNCSQIAIDKMANDKKARRWEGGALRARRFMRLAGTARPTLC